MKDTIRYEAFSWDALLKIRRGTSKLLIHKRVVSGFGLQPDVRLHNYIASTSDNRPVLVVFLDGKPRIGGDSNGSKKETS